MKHRGTKTTLRALHLAKAYRGRLGRKKSVMPIDRRDSPHRNRDRLYVNRERARRRAFWACTRLRKRPTPARR